MPNTQRLTWDGICLHAGSLPGYPSSHGCVHLPLEFSAKLFEITHMGTPVIIADNASAPADIVHPGIILSGDADQIIAQKLALERSRKRQTVTIADADRSSGDAIVSVLVSGQDRKSYLLKDGQIVDQNTITVINPGQALGTHVLVLKTFEGRHPTWSGVAIDHSGSPGAVQPPDIATLDRITFDPEFVEKTLAAIHPGTIFMITDLAAGPETRSDSDFVIVTSEYVQS